MSFLEQLETFDAAEFNRIMEETTVADVERILSKRILDLTDMAALLSPQAANCLEPMAQRAHVKRTQHFGKAVVLYTPMYLANYCVNGCTYCGYNVHNRIDRHKLSTEGIEREAKAISETGLKHILILTGESKVHTPVQYIVDSVKILKKYFDSISIEIYPLDEDEYKQVVDAGVDGLTIYQETYDPVIYDEVHLSGPKKDFPFRLAAPERGAKKGMRSVNIGPLLGLGDWRMESFKAAWHAAYLQKNYPEVELAMSFPRMRPHAGCFEVKYPVYDKDFVQILLALGNFLPSVGITMSTRESAEFRNNLVPLGITKMSAGVSTAVGGHGEEEVSEAQFQISDGRSVEEMRQFLLSIGYQPVFKDWMDISADLGDKACSC